MLIEDLFHKTAAIIAVLVINQSERRLINKVTSVIYTRNLFNILVYVREEITAKLYPTIITYF